MDQSRDTASAANERYAAHVLLHIQVYIAESYGHQSSGLVLWVHCMRWEIFLRIAVDAQGYAGKWVWIGAHVAHDGLHHADALWTGHFLCRRVERCRGGETEDPRGP